jgi:energy-coupling factor transporter ATP-binding protein EcfA2
MSDAISSSTEPFPSLAAFRQAHVSLLQRHRAGLTATLLDEIEAAVERGSATGAVLDDEGERWEAQGVLDYWVAVLYRARRNPMHGTLQPFDPSLAPELPDESCPYRGLEAFREAQHGVFFGRTRVVTEMVNRLSSGRLLAILGPSGSGKSSLVLAGLIPSLKSGRVAEHEATPASDRWQYLPPIVPGIHPLLSLASVIGGAVATAERRQQEADAMSPEPQRFVRHLDAGGVPSVVIVDQFEEVFTLCTDEAERRAFVDTLLAVTQSKAAAHRVVLTMRSDFEPQIAALPKLQAVFDRAQYRIPPFNAAELREVIEKPAELVGLKFEEGIVDRLVNEILGEPAGLPLLQFALLKLWERRDRNRVTFEAYRSVGGPLKALERSAEELYARLLAEEQVTARRILLRIVRPGNSLEVTSNRVLRNSVHGSEPRERVDRVLDKLIAAGLLRQTGGPRAEEVQIEVAHEALLRNWPRLVEWLDDERIRLRRRFSVTAAAQQWAAHGKDPGGLLGGSLLEEAGTYDDLDATEREFVVASSEALARETRQKERAFRVLVGLLVLVIVFATGIALIAVRLQRALGAEREQRNSLEFALAEADNQMTARVAAELQAQQARSNAVTAVEAASQAVEAIDEQRADRHTLETAKSIIEETQNKIAAYGRTGSMNTPANVVAPPKPTVNPAPIEPPDDAPKAEPPKTQPPQTELPSPSYSASPPANQLDPSAGGASGRPPRITAGARAAPRQRESLLSGIEIRASSESTGGVVEKTTLPLYHFKIWLDGSPEALARVKGVQYEFDHPTFAEKTQRSENPRNGFERGYRGWGCLASVKVTVFPAEAGNRPETVNFDMCAAVSFRYKK